MALDLAWSTDPQDATRVILRGTNNNLNPITEIKVWCPAAGRLFYNPGPIPAFAVWNGIWSPVPGFAAPEANTLLVTYTFLGLPALEPLLSWLPFM